MRKKILILIIIMNLSCSDKATVSEITSTKWALEKREQFLSNRTDPTTWDKELLKSDKEMIGIGEFGPFEIGVFPVPRYDIVGKESFKGLGNKSGDFHIKQRNILMNSFFIEKNKLNESRLKGMKDRVFFQIMVLTDTIDDQNYHLNKSIIISRNHPDYLGQGFIKTKDNKIDYLAFQTAENNAYAIINTRIFDLNFGKTILIAPQKDGTLKSLQVKSPELSSESIIEYTNEFIKDIKTIKFFDETENI